MIHRIESVCQTLLDRWYVATLQDYALLIATIVVIGWLIARASERRSGMY